MDFQYLVVVNRSWHIFCEYGSSLSRSFHFPMAREYGNLIYRVHDRRRKLFDTGVARIKSATNGGKKN